MAARHFLPRKQVLPGLEPDPWTDRLSTDFLALPGAFVRWSWPKRTRFRWQLEGVLQYRRNGRGQAQQPVPRRHH
jgi:hypothetical protein